MAADDDSNTPTTKISVACMGANKNTCDRVISNRMVGDILSEINLWGFLRSKHVQASTDGLDNRVLTEVETTLQELAHEQLQYRIKNPPPWKNLFT